MCNINSLALGDCCVYTHAYAFAFFLSPLNMPMCVYIHDDVVVPNIYLQLPLRSNRLIAGVHRVYGIFKYPNMTTLLLLSHCLSPVVKATA